MKLVSPDQALPFIDLLALVRWEEQNHLSTSILDWFFGFSQLCIRPRHSLAEADELFSIMSGVFWTTLLRDISDLGVRQISSSEQSTVCIPQGLRRCQGG